MSPLVDSPTPNNQSLLIPSPVLGIYVLLAVSVPGAIFKDATLTEQCVVEIIWMVYVPEHVFKL